MTTNAELTIAITGHRPEDLGDDPAWVWGTLQTALERANATHLIQGMAAGADLLSAEVAHFLQIPYTCAKPWAGHAPRTEDKLRYEKILARAAKVVNVTDSAEYLGPGVYHQRNEWMVDNADLVIAIWNGKRTGGTAAAVRYAKKQAKPLIIINPATKTVNWGDYNTHQELTLF